jgi:hypothetical protein
MKIKFFNVALGLALSATVMSASAQKNYTEGVITYGISSPNGDVDSKTYFKGDSSINISQFGPATVKVITNTQASYVAILVDVPVASVKKAAVLSPAEVEDAKAQAPNFTFTPGTETKQISGFNCKKVVAKDVKSGSTYDAWVTTDISIPLNGLTRYFEKAGGVPVQFTTIQQGQTINVVLKSVTADPVPAGTFGIPKDFDKITLEELKAMSGGR